MPGRARRTSLRDTGLVAERQVRLRRQGFGYPTRAYAATLDVWNREFEG
jgi:hypothetical protein